MIILIIGDKVTRSRRSAKQREATIGRKVEKAAARWTTELLN